MIDYMSIDYFLPTNRYTDRTDRLKTDRIYDRL